MRTPTLLFDNFSLPIETPQMDNYTLKNLPFEGIDKCRHSL